MLRWFEQLVDPFRDPGAAPGSEWRKTAEQEDGPDPGSAMRPPDSLGLFYWHFVRQVWPLFVALLLIGAVQALIEVSLFAFLGQLVDLMRTSPTPAAFLSEHSSLLLWMAFVALILRPIAVAAHSLLTHQSIMPTFMNLIRWQNHRYVLRQSLSFFQNDFAGRIATKVMQTGGALRESVLQSVEALWFVLIYAVSALVLFAQNDVRLTLPLILWIAMFSGILFYFIPRIKRMSKVISETRSLVNGRLVDSYTNIETVKLFARADGEDDAVREALGGLVSDIQKQMRFVTMFEVSVITINGFLIVGTGGLAIWLWSAGNISLGAIALATGLVLRINNMSQWVMWVVTGIFENIGAVQNGMETIARENELVDAPRAKALRIDKAEVRYEGISFHYGKHVDAGARGVVENLSLIVKPGEKVGLVGRSGAGKSTLVNLLLRFYDLEGGRIVIDGQDIASVTQDSLRANIGMVTQDTSLLHRSVMDNIRYGNSGASEADAIAAAKLAQAHEFILGLEDMKGRRGYDAEVGERGVKLSGGQRQRIAIARVLLKDAPILVLDEATSALDSEIEAALQEQFENLMQGKTVIAIAHRLSTIAAMDRLVVMDEGRIVESGTHDELVARGGIYAALWSRQSGGFLAIEAASSEGDAETPADREDAAALQLRK